MHNKCMGLYRNRTTMGVDRFLNSLEYPSAFTPSYLVVANLGVSCFFWVGVCCQKKDRVIPENINTPFPHLMEGRWKFRGGGEAKRLKLISEEQGVFM